MTFYPNERIALFIDGANLYATVKIMDYDIDYGRMLDLFKNKGRLIRAAYYTAIYEKDDYAAIRPLTDWLDYNGYHLITKPAKDLTDRDGRRRVKGNMDIEMAIDMVEAAAYIDHMVLFSGDGDFRAAIAAVQKKGVRVTVVSTRQSNPPMLSDELRRQADAIIDLDDLEPMIGRE